MPMSVADEIRRAAFRLVGYGTYVSMGRLRAALPGVSRQEFDAAITELYRRPDVTIGADSDDRNLSAAERAAAVTVGGQSVHLFKLRDPRELDKFDLEDMADAGLQVEDFRDQGPKDENPSDRRERNLNEAEALEEELSTIATFQLTADVRSAAVSILSDFLRGVTGRSLFQLVSDRLQAIRPRVGAELTGQLGRAVALGVQQGNEVATGTARPIAFRDPALNAELANLDPAILGHLRAAIELGNALPLDDQASVMSVLARSYRATTSADQGARWAVNRAISVGTAQVAEQNGANIVWIAERDGCLHCLALQGQVIEPGQEFSRTLTFGDKPLPVYGDLKLPPRHPNCRCQVDLTYAPVGTDESLVREAQRAVARGTSLASEPARFRAVDRLLASPNLLPKSVRERARRAVANGEFPDRRRIAQP